LSISNGIWKKTNMKSRNKIKMSSGNSTRYVGEVNAKIITEVYRYYIHILVKNLALLYVNYQCNEVLQTVHHHK